MAFLWIWTGLVFWIITFGPYSFTIFGLTIQGNWILLGVFFIIQGCLFIFFGIIRPKFSFSVEKDSYFYLGLFFMVYALIIYPIIGIFTGHPFPDYPVFGIAPCPVTIFTFGLLLWTDKKFNLMLILIPFVYSLVGIMPLVLYEVFADLGLIIIGIVGFILIVYRDRKRLEVGS